MRSLEDCKAEVFRRSEERIKERKRNRNRVLVCCIPLCLLLVAGGIYICPLLEPVDENLKVNKEDVTTENVTMAVTSVKIRNVGADSDVYREITDEDIVECFYNSILVCFEENVPESTTGWDREESVENKAEYEFTFGYENGKETAFRLGENGLTDVTRALEIRLTEEQLNTLKMYLELAK